MEPSREDTYVDAHGVRIHYSVWEHPSPRATVQLLHGLGDHHRRYDHVASALVAAGYEVWADDHRGHGRTGLEQHGAPAAMGPLGNGGHDATVAAIFHFTDAIAAARPGIPHVLLGHSWGSMLAQILLNRYGYAYDAVVLSGTIYRMPGWANGGDLGKRHRASDGNEHAWLSRDPAVWEAAEADEFMFPGTMISLFGVRNTLATLGKPAKNLPAALPLLIIVGDDDALGGPRSARRLEKAYRGRSGLTDVTLIVYPGGRHELFNEVDKAKVMADVVDWVDARIG